MVRTLLLILFLLFTVLQYRLWVGEGSLAELHALKREIAGQKAELDQLHRRNQKLQAEVNDLKTGLEVIEERARNELGMIGKGEIFYQIIDRQKGAKQ